MLELCDVIFFTMVTIIFPVVTSKSFCDDVGFLVLVSSDALNLQCKYLIDKERKKMWSQGSKTETDCEMPSMVRYEICGSQELGLFLKLYGLVALPAPSIT